MERELETTCWPALDAGWALEEASRSGEEGEVARRLLSDWLAFAAGGGEAALPPGYGGETLRDLARASEKLAELQRVAAGVAPSPARPRNAAASAMARAPALAARRREAPLRRGAPRRRRRLPRRRRVAEPAAAELPLAQARRGLHAAGGGEALVALGGSGAARGVWVGALAGRVAARCAARERARKDRGDAETGADRLRDALRSWRDVLSRRLGRPRRSFGVAVDALCGPDLADAAVLVDGVAARLCDDGALGLRARVRLREGAGRRLRRRARGEKDFAIKGEPGELPALATLLFRDELSGRADGVARALGGGDELLHRWRAALADEVFAVVEAHLAAALRVSARRRAFVLGRDVDELRRAVSDLGSDRADAHFAALREGVAVFKLDPESLKYLVLQPDGPPGLDRAQRSSE
ncbi:hypothetical protein SO694_00039238 [Aureococcus anophagefferens]|uniref:Uncharacterized protein n=1 Tax=Aureococcus anophagefferens TaxID=44056 RepID=A0ABR1FLM5_AURAN